MASSSPTMRIILPSDAVRRRLSYVYFSSSCAALLIVAFTCALLSLPSSTRAASIPDENRFKSISSELDQELAALLDSASDFKKVHQSYRDTQQSLSFRQEDGASLVRGIADKLGKIFEKKVTALREAANFAEGITMKYDWNSSVKDMKLDYVYAREVNISEGFEEVEQFNGYVNFDNSSVHVPIDIYRKDVKILQTLSWTSAMDQIWKQNREKDESLSWQYFGSQTGVLRTYPASKWPENDEPDLYDVRRRPWYTQGASSPKEMLILIDTSGSCHGQALALMKHSIASIIDTLSENDFVNVASFSDQVSVVGCFQTFVQANPRNKKKLNQYVQNLHANGVANYSRGFEFALNQFEKYKMANKTEGDGADCNQVIMFLTDGGTDKSEEVFKKQNPDKKVRIFSYAVGPIANPKAAVKWIGCYNRGFFYEIPAMGAIRSTVQEHLVYLANPQALDYGVHTWTSVYLDKLGLGLVTSATLPVFNRSQDVGNQTLVGVVGVDVPISELTNVIPDHKFGPGGYAFIINPNGIIVYHPNLKTEGEYNEPPSLDFVELEEETPEKLQVRKEMIDQVTNHMEINSYILGLDDSHVELKKRHYYYTGIPNSNFSLAVVLPDRAGHYFEIRTKGNIMEGIRQLTNSKSTFVINYSDYCTGIKPISNISTPLEDFIDFLQNNLTQCDDEKIEQLLFDLNTTMAVDNFWAKRDESQKQDGILATLVEGHRGFVRLYPQNISEQFQAQLMKWKENQFRRTRDSDIWLLNAADSVSTNATGPILLAAKGVNTKVSSSSRLQNLAAVGVALTQSAVRTVVMETLRQQLDASVSCYLIDDGGFVVFECDKEAVETAAGKFFGASAVEPHLMAELVNKSIFIQRSAYDYQGTCFATTPEVISSGHRLLPFFMYDILSLNWWTATSTWTYTSVMGLFTWLFTPSYVAGEEAVYKHVESKTEAGKSCIRLIQQYHFNPDVNDEILTGTVPCTADCSRSYAVSRLKNLNLLFVLVDSSSTCQSSCDNSLTTLLLHGPKETEDPLFASSQCEVKVRYRRRPPCFEDKPSEHDSYCGACSRTASRFLLIVVVLLSISSMPTWWSFT